MGHCRIKSANYYRLFAFGWELLGRRYGVRSELVLQGFIAGRSILDKISLIRIS